MDIRTFVPRHRAAVAPREMPHSAGEEVLPARQSSVLVVEDHAESASALVVLIRMEGHRVFLARNMHEALAIAAAEPIDLVISDIHLPDGDGCSLMETLRDRHQVLGIGMTGDDRVLDGDFPLIEHGFIKVLLKPIQFSELFAAIRSVTGHGK